MKKVALITLSVVLMATLIFSALPAMAAKPQNVIAYSNGFPSGLHFNLNIHGKNPETFVWQDEWDGVTPYTGNSVFIAEYTSDYGPATIKYISDKRFNGLYELQVTDPIAMPDPYGDDDGAEVKIPWHVMTDEGQEVNVSGYYVFARILGKPNNGKPKNGDPSPSSMILYPNVVVGAENDSNSTMPLGLITQQHTYVAAPEGFVRFDPEVTKGKGKSKAKDITHLFTWSGWVAWGTSPDYDGDDNIDQDDLDAAYADALLDIEHYYWDIPDLDGVTGINLGEWVLFHPDTDDDGDVDEQDVADALSAASTYLDASHYDSFFDLLDQDDDTVVTVEEWLKYQETLGHAQEFINEWIFNVADYVATEQQIDNDGTKLLQIRFYPIETTEYVQPARIVVGKLTNPAGAEESFTFDTDYSDDFSLKDGEGYISDSLTPGPYSITEILPSGWTLTDVTIIEDNTNSSGWTAGTTVDITLDAEETVYVTFINTEEVT
ncbi:hypothetical protein ACFLS8_03765 [Chloroflexota bacterium]